MIKHLTTIFLVGLALRVPAQIKSDDGNHVPKSYWAAGGIGVSALGDASVSLTTNAEIKNRILLSANYTGDASLDIYGDYSVDVNSFNVLAGKIYKQRNSLISFSAGLGLTRIYTFDGRGVGYHETKEKTISIPLSVQAYAIGFQAAGVGVNLYGNLNLKQCTAGLHLGVALGRIATRPRR